MCACASRRAKEDAGAGWVWEQGGSGAGREALAAGRARPLLPCPGVTHRDCWQGTWQRVGPQRRKWVRAQDTRVGPAPGRPHLPSLTHLRHANPPHASPHQVCVTDTIRLADVWDLHLGAPTTAP